MQGPNTNICVGVVDDDESICRSLGRLLRAAGIQVITYPSAEEFLQDEKRPRFDCLVLDVRLGGVSGIDLQQRLAAPGDAPPVIFITAHDDPDVRERAQRAGCIGYFRKTAPGDAVLAAIRGAVGDKGGSRKEKQ
jgi:FixJ family two-component response regulator